MFALEREWDFSAEGARGGWRGVWRGREKLGVGPPVVEELVLVLARPSSDIFVSSLLWSIEVGRRCVLLVD